MKKKNLVFCFIVLVSLCLGGYLLFNFITEAKQVNEGIIQFTQSDFPIAKDTSEMIDAADVIAMGEYVNYVKSMNMARDINDVNLEDSERYVEGKIYSFAVDEYLYGAGEDKIDIILLYQRDGMTAETYYDPNVDEKVILCLKYIKDFAHYYAAIYPFEFLLNRDQVNVRTNLDVALEESQSFYTVLERIAEKVTMKNNND